MFKVDKLNIETIGNIIYEDSPSFSGIVAGECKGDIWVDNVEVPSIALVYSFAVGGFSILGKPRVREVYSKFKKFILENMLNELKSRDFEDFEFGIESEEAKSHILEIFNDKVIETAEEYVFQKNEKYNETITIPEGYNILKVDSSLLEKLKDGVYENQEIITERLLESWGSYEDFLKKSIAFVAVNKNRIVAVIIGTAKFKNIIPVDIETEDIHRNKGLALALTNLLVNECIDNGFIVQWNCMDYNIASRRTAKKAGFQFLKMNTVYWFEI